MWNSARWAPTVHTAGGHCPPRQGGVGSPILPSGPNFPEVPPQPCVPAPSPKCRSPSGRTGWPRPLQHASPPAPSSPSSLSASPVSAGPTPQNLPVWEAPLPRQGVGHPLGPRGDRPAVTRPPRPPEAALSLASPGVPVSTLEKPQPSARAERVSAAGSGVQRPRTRRLPVYGGPGGGGVGAAVRSGPGLSPTQSQQPPPLPAASSTAALP